VPAICLIQKKAGLSASFDDHRICSGCQHILDTGILCSNKSVKRNIDDISLGMGLFLFQRLTFALSHFCY
jgi:hypothetical protein